MPYIEGWDPERWDALDIIQPSGRVIRTEMGSSSRTSPTKPAEVDELDRKVRPSSGFCRQFWALQPPRAGRVKGEGVC